MPFTHAIVLDFEATCVARGRLKPQEIIEFPSVVVEPATGRMVAEFQAFVRPVHHPVLSDFCTELTGITQGDVDGAESFPETLTRHTAWLAEHGLNRENALLVTCGDWDLNSMLPNQLRASGIKPSGIDPIYGRWLNIKKLYCRVFDQPRVGGMRSMLRGLGLELEGRHHRGIDDCRNIARILLALLERGGRMEATGGHDGGQKDGPNEDDRPRKGFEPGPRTC